MNNLFAFNKLMSLRRRQAMIVLGVTVITLSVSSLAFFINDYTTTQRNIASNLDKLAELVSVGSASALINGDRLAAQKVLDIAGADDALRGAVLYDREKQFFASYLDKQSGIAVADVFPDKELLSPGPDFSTLLHPVLYQNEVRGWLYLVYDKKRLWVRDEHYLGIVMIIFMLGIAIAWIMSSVAQRFIVDPVVQLATMVEKITRTKNYSERMHVIREDEIGTLMLGMNNMLATIQDREEELKRHGERLESLVELRTKQLHHRANYDALTRLPNRYLLMEKLHQAIESARRTDRYMALLLIDLDRFKIINDSLGHHVGDELLQTLAKRLSEISRVDDCVGRLGGDEFVILLGNIASPSDAEVVAQKIMEELSAPFELQHHRLHVSASIGISVFPKDADDAVSLLKRADISMYRSKSQGKGTYRFYDGAMDNTDQRLILESKLRHAVENNELYIVYQPQIQVEANSVCGVEALLRWDNPEQGEIDPQVFIPMAEEMGFISEISTWVIDKVCEQQRFWRQQGLPPIKVAVNVSASDLLRSNFVNLITDKLTEYEVEAGHLEIEITEDVFLDQTEQIITTLRELKKLGVAIAIDDFGTGYSSLSYLQNLPVDILKLDGSFVRNIHESQKSRGIVSSAISLAHGLGLQIVAECVDKQDQLDFLVSEGCDIVQGFYFSEALVGESLAVFLAARNSRYLVHGRMVS